MLLLFPSSSGGGGGGGGSTTTNYMLMLSLTSDVAAPPPPSGTNYMLMLSLTSEGSVIPPPPVDTGSVGSSMSGGYFSRKKWHTLIGEIQAERDAARAIKNATQRKAVVPAGVLADQALKAARDAEESAQVASDLRAMTNALQAAAGAKSLSQAIAQANEAKEFARSAIAAMIAYQDFEDEEEAIALLLMH